MRHTTQSSQLGFRPDIEGLRGLAVTLVVVYHTNLGIVPGGYLGVDVFFVLSGFLISWLLMQEARETASVDLPAFYARRARRLLPAAMWVVLVTAVLSYWAYPPLQHAVNALSAFSALAYFSNFYFLYLVKDYFSPGAAGNPFLHTWSLSVEEQFYLAWPLLILVALWAHRACRLRERTSLLLIMSLVFGVSLVASLVLAEVRLSWTFFLSPTRAWEFASGGIAALFARQSLEQGDVSPRARRWLAAGAAACLAVLLASAFLLNEATPFPGLYAIPPVLATAGLLYCCSFGGDTKVAWLLSNPGLRRIGLVSYSWYLWHWPFFVLFEAMYGAASTWQTVSLMLGSYMAAEASYRWVELPVRHHPSLVRSHVRSLLLVAAAVVLGAAIVVVQPWLPLGEKASVHRQLEQMRYKDGNPLQVLGCAALQDEVQARPCSFGAKQAQRTVVLLGDSHAAQWFPLTNDLAKARDWRLLTLVKTACPYADLEVLQEANKRPYRECSAWRESALQEIERIKPEVVLAASSFFYGIDADQWRKGMERTLRRLSAVSQHVIFIRDNPRPGFVVPACVSKDLWRQGHLDAETCAFSSPTALGTEVYDAQVQAAQGLSNVQPLDLMSNICPNASRCPAVLGELAIYRDSNHLSADFVRTLAPVFESHLGQFMGGQ